MIQRLIEHIRCVRMNLAHVLLPKDVSKSIDLAIALTYAIEEEEGWAKAGDPEGETRTLYMPASLWPLYQKFMDGTCLAPDDSVYAELPNYR